MCIEKHTQNIVYKCSFIIYRKTPIISPGLIFVRKAVLLGLFSAELIIGPELAFQNGLGLTIKQLAVTIHGLIFRRAYHRKDFCV